MKLLAVLLLTIGLLFAGCLIGATMGAISGFVVGLAFDGSMVLLAQALGIPDAQPYQLGAIAGFLGSFFSPTISATSKAKE